MRRDMELIRKMVLAVEDHPTGWAPGTMHFDGYTGEQIGYHGYLLVDAGLAVGIEITAMGDTGPMYVVRQLTSAGHDFAENARNEFIWNEAWATIKEKGLKSTTLDVVNRVLKKQVHKHLGID